VKNNSRPLIRTILSQMSSA